MPPSSTEGSQANRASTESDSGDPVRPSTEAQVRAELARARKLASDAAAVAALLRETNEKLILATLRSQELADSSERASALFDSLPDMIARFDREYRYVYVNEAAERFTGCPREEAIGHTNEELGVSPKLCERWKALIADGFSSHAAAETVQGFDFERGGNRLLQIRALPEKTEDGAVTSVVTIVRDVTESAIVRRALEDADRVRRMQSVTAAFSVARTPEDVAGVLVTHAQEALNADAAMVMLIDESGRKMDLAAVVGYPGPVPESWRTLSLDAHAPLADSARSHAPLFFETPEALFERYPAPKAARFVDDRALAAIPLAIGDQSFGALAIVYWRPRPFDAEEREFSMSLARHSAQAIDRARLLQAERKAREAAETANRLKDEFLATMSHELRTPLNAVVGWSALLRTKTFDAASLKNAVEAIHRNARAQAKIVEDVLDVSRIISGKLKLDIEVVDLSAIVRQAIEVVRPAADAKSIALGVIAEERSMVSADPARLQQVVWNLVSNAVKFTPERGRIDVEVRHRGASVVLEVRDTGMGIELAFLPYVFERFTQHDGSSTRRYGGLGLGLAIVRHLVELHGGTVTAESEGPERGATFRVELRASPSDVAPAPREQPSFPPSALPLQPPADLRGVTVLLVDDDRDAREIVAATLRDDGAEVFAMTGADEALGALSAVRPDVVICDIAMPGTDGYTFMRCVRALAPNEGGSTPAIAVTGYARSEDMRRAFAAGYQVHLSKPVDLAALERAVASLLDRESRPSV
jgi:PAS domain S-box-containing protein